MPGGPGVVTAVLSSGKRGIGAGAGNPPALVDETADRRKVRDSVIGRFARLVFHQILELILNIGAQVNGNDGRRSFVGAKTVVVARGACAHAKQQSIVINSLNEGTQEDEEADVFGRLVTRSEQVLSVIDHDGPVVVLARSVNAVKRLFRKQACQVVYSLIRSCLRSSRDMSAISSAEVT